ncbi:sortase [Cryobacterium sp. TMT1-21]|uniref:Sortase n=1 Tax=Cryobacterium shii TaxID=1259235 RepID=A0AAQ2C780_9MICO|nr:MULTISPECIES: sortase [Cryobacterium]TFC49552.1 sortase [Cryobacterium shii]TFC83127.1 sortase [Cryobacterium sp. TmT2-59]TFD08666.1 sortase [Cryobacterium sp. TMT1-21]TFD15550.1 sortase [Cryobacterium sp. TMT4-10]TFD15866.1 sortase [Cryobacterium sp. TMT2-23]
MDAQSLAALISEVLTLVGLVVGAALFAAGLFVRGIKGRWLQTDGVIASSASGTVIRWFDTHGEVHERPADTHETHRLPPGEDVPLWFNARTPSRCRTHTPESEGKALRLTGLVLLIVGAASGVLGIVLMFL